MISNRPQEIVKSKFSAGLYNQKGPNGIPAQYSIEPLEDHELPVIGTFIHNHILPGFRYRVRLNGTNDYFFDGKAMQLESIGQGYGKRLTFESNDILNNDNFFWSDSNDVGFVFSIQVLFPQEAFQVYDKHGMCIGNFSIDSVDDKQIVKGVAYKEDLVSVHAGVNFHGTLWLFPQPQSCPLSSLCEKEIPLMGSGIAIVNRLSSTLKLMETEKTQGRILKLLNIEHFIKLVK